MFQRQPWNGQMKPLLVQLPWALAWVAPIGVPPAKGTPRWRQALWKAFTPLVVRTTMTDLPTRNNFV